MTITEERPAETPVASWPTLEVRATVQELLDALATLAVVPIPKRGAPNSAKCYLDVTTLGTAKLSAYGFDLSAEVTLSADTFGAGAIAVDRVQLTSAIKSFSGNVAKKRQDLHLAVNGLGRLTIRDDNGSVVALETAPVADDDYRPTPKLANELGHFDADDLASVARIATHAGGDDVLPALMQVQLIASGGRWSAAASDRCTLGQVATGCVYHETPDASKYLIPAQVITKLAKLFKGQRVRMFEVVPTSSTLRVDFTARDKSHVVMVNVPSYGFPDVSRVWPKVDTVCVATFDQAALLDAAKGIAATATRNAPVRLTFTETAVTLTLGTDGESGATRSVPVVAVGDETVVAVNPAYLVRALTSLGAGEVTLSLYGKTTPLAFARPSDHMDVLVMPMRITG